MPMLRRLLPLALLAALPVAFAGGDDDDEDVELDFQMDAPARMKVAAPAAAPLEFAADGLSATAGGLQDIAWVRSELRVGRLPPPEAFAAEGLLSEHDLPARQVGPCPRLLCVLGEAAILDLPGVQDATVLAQLGFGSSLSAATYVRPPLNLVVVVDQSASMSGEAFRTQIASLMVLSQQLREVDQIELITVDDEARVLLAPTPGDQRDAVTQALRGLSPWGQTRLFDGVSLAFDEARASARSFAGLSRVIVLSDQRPSVGAREPSEFVRLAESGARAGVGLTTVAVGREPDFQLVNDLSQVRGGNAFGFTDLRRMIEVFTEELDTLAVALAYDLSLEISPAHGWRLAGVYGVPGAALRWDSTGTARLHVDTLFLSTKGGAIYLSFAPEAVSSLPAAPARPGAAVATIGMSYEPLDGPTVLETLGLRLSELPPSLGLARGRLLVGEIEALNAGLAAGAGRHPYDEAKDTVDAALSAMASAEDPSMAEELRLLLALKEQLWVRSAY